ncbi:MAG: hypothetical protein JO353_01675 [Phycisphaerae bacterium]|nr:hypothetical protein [Phycisphaerae bacterium]
MPLLIYLAIAVPGGFQIMERLNSDGVCYLHRAMLLARGDFHDAIAAYWSPGLIVSTVPMLKLGIDPLHAIHWTLLVWGAVYVIGGILFFENVWAASILALVALRLSTSVITPDVLLGTAMLFYLVALRRRRWFIAGLIAGIGFWTKAYFLPFFVLHFAMTILWMKGGWRAMVAGACGFIIVAGPWIGILSEHEGKLTFSSATTRNRFMQDVAPADVLAHPPDVSSVPPGPFISNMEVTDHDDWPRWSPLDSYEHFRQQMRVALQHLGEIIADVWRFDYAGFTLLAVVLALAIGDRDSRWLVISGTIYAAGFLLVVYETRYILPVLLPIGLSITLAMARRIRWNPLVPLVLIAFAGSAAWADYDVITQKQSRVTYRQIAAELKSHGIHDRFVTNTANRDKAACTAFFMDQKFIAMPNDRDPSVLQLKLNERGVVYLFDWFDPQYADSDAWPEPQTRAILGDGMWIEQFRIRLDSKRSLVVYKHRPSA